VARSARNSLEGEKDSEKAGEEEQVPGGKTVHRCAPSGNNFTGRYRVSQ